MDDVLVARGLGKDFGPVRAVNGVDLRVRAGEVVGLLGPNGAGKTTTLRMLVGVISPSQGEILINGVDLRQQLLPAKQRIGFLSGDTQLYQRLSPREVLTYFGRLYGVSEPARSVRIAQLISELGMQTFCDRPCRTLSSGQKQRANIARAFLHQPDVLILDEPTATLDVISGQFIVEAIRRERAAGRAVLFSTHIMSEAEYLCDRVYLMLDGGIADHGTLPELLERTGTRNLTDAFFHYLPANPA